MFNPIAPFENQWDLYFCKEAMPLPEHCDKDGKCWWGRSQHNMHNADWFYASPKEVKDYCDGLMPDQWAPWHTFPQPERSCCTDNNEDSSVTKLNIPYLELPLNG